MQSLAHSIKYKKLDDDLYPFKRWKKEKRTVLKTLDYSKLLTPIRRTLDAKEVELNKLYKVVNQSVIKGENSFVKIKTNKKGEKVWKLTPYEAEEGTEDSILSTDKHGKNSLNFALFDFVEMIFCPRIPKAHREGLWGFGTAANYKDYIIKPTHFVDMNLIESEWDNMQRMAASIITGEASPSVVIRNLSSKEYSSRTKRAFVQYNNIVKSHFILQYIHDAEFRRAVTDALNRGEKYNSLYRAITLFNNGQH